MYLFVRLYFKLVKVSILMLHKKNKLRNKQKYLKVG